MRSWLRRSVTPSRGESEQIGSPSRKSKAPSAVSSFGAHLWPSKSDPTTWREAFQSHWLQAYGIIQQRNSGTPTSEQLSTIFNHLDQMFLLLLTESNSQEERIIGPILDYFFTEDILSQVFCWIRTTHQSVECSCLLHMLKLYEGLVTQSYQCLLVHKPILYPLLQVLEACSSAPKNSFTEDMERHFVLLLNQICTKIADDATLLEFFFNRSPEEGPRFLVFTLMIPYLYVEADIGQLARDAMLLILAVSRKVESVGHFIAEHSNFCPVLATGLSGCFSQLPRRLAGASDDWHSITMHDIEALPALHSFYSSLVFCNAVVQVGHSFVLEQLLDYIYHGFLVSVNGLEELISATAYLDLCFRTVTEPCLMKIFVRFILSEQYDGKRVLETLVERINNNSRLCLISLALFSTLLELNCEDLMLELVLKYLIPCTHIMISQSQNLKDMDYYGKTAEKFLSLTPRCCKIETPDPSSTTIANGTETVGDSQNWADSPNYLEYLIDARLRVLNAYKGCACWAFPYDGENPDPELFREVGSVASTSPASSPRSTASSSFRRQSSLRRSRPNSYFTRRHTSGVSTGAAVMTATDLAVLGPEEFEDPFADLPSPCESGGPSSVLSTPRFEKSVGAPTDYFKLAFDEDILPAASEGEESDIPRERENRQMSSSFILRGWTEVEDLGTFVEVLNRVRTGQETGKYSLEDNLKFLEKRTEGTREEERKELVESKDSGIVEGQGRKGKEEEDVEEGVTEVTVESRRDSVAAIPVSFRSSFSTPSLGPFLTILLQKMESMVQNTLFINLQLTGVLSRLACYPQPLLSSFLLNSSLVFQPSMRSLFQVLGSLKHRIDAYAYSVNSFEGLLWRGRKHLSSREKRFFSQRDRSCSDESAGSTAHGGKPRSFSEMFHLSSSPDKRGNLPESKPRAYTIEAVNTGLKNHRFYQHKTHQSTESSLEALRTKNMVYCAIVLEEFLKELAAISQEHTVAYQLRSDIL